MVRYDNSRPFRFFRYIFALSLINWKEERATHKKRSQNSACNCHREDIALTKEKSSHDTTSGKICVSRHTFLRVLSLKYTKRG